MSVTTANDELEPAPDIVLGGFRLRVLAREFPNARDEWDGNWLLAEAECNARGARVMVEGPFILAQELAVIAASLEVATSMRERHGSVQLMEPYLSLLWDTSTHGGFRLIVAITPDQLTQKHEFIFDLDLSYLDATIAQCRAVLARFPVRSHEPT